MMANPQDREQHYGLGNLSDSILQHILSFLPTQEAVQTSILSRRWRYLWTEISTLNFNKRSPYNESLYTHKFVDGLFSALLCHKSKTLFKCQLLLCKNDGSIVFQAADQCILNAITKNVQELLITGTLVPYTLPATLFRHKSLQVLSLQGCNLGHAGSMDLRLLKDLRLTEVRAAYGMFQCLISSCLLLENLMFEGCSNMGDLLISLLHLRNLTIKYCHNLRTVQVEAPELRCFQFEGQLQEEFELHIAEIPSLIRADISFCCRLHVSCFDSIIKLTQFMGNFSPIKFLNLSAYYIEDLVLLGNGLDDEDNDDGGGDKDLMLATNLLEYLPPLLCNLKRLQLRGSFCSIKSIFVFATLLKMSPYLEELSLSLIPAVPKWPLDPSKTELMDWKKLSINCLHHHLTTIEILQFEGDNIQNMLAKFLLGNGEVLEEVHIESTKALFSHHMKINKLLFSWRANPNTKIRYY